MRWYDAADDAKARNALLQPSQEPEQFAEGVAFRCADNTTWGRWRVTKETMESSTWVAYDLRRGPEARVAVMLGRFGTPQRAVLFIEAYSRSRAARLICAAYRGCKVVRHLVREEWGLR